MPGDASLAAELFDAVMADDLDAARSVVGRQPREFRMVADLLARIGGQPPPLEQLRADFPKFVYIPTSYTCANACKMCHAGFEDRVSLYADRKYFLPAELELLTPWIESARYVHFVGAGETLNSPFLPEFLRKASGKISVFTTSGVPLTRENVLLFIQSGLHVLDLSFDGKTALGHGGGSEGYIAKFWEKVKLTQAIKEERKSGLPKVGISITLNKENAEQLDELLARAFSHGVELATLFFMLPLNADLFAGSIFPDYENFRSRTNKVIAQWIHKGMKILACQVDGEIPETFETCRFVGNIIAFTRSVGAPQLCCGLLDIPARYTAPDKDAYWNSFPLRYFRYLHLCLPRENQPAVCKGCPNLNPRHFAEIVISKPREGEPGKALLLFRMASQLKRDGRDGEAENLFIKLLGLDLENPLKGKIYFHLGELRIKQRQYPEALADMKLAVQHCFDHKMAFVYLYLLMAILEDVKSAPRKPVLHSAVEMIWEENIRRREEIS